MKLKIITIILMTMMLTMSMALGAIQPVDEIYLANGNTAWTNTALASDGNEATFANANPFQSGRIVHRYFGTTADFVGSTINIRGEANIEGAFVFDSLEVACRSSGSGTSLNPSPLRQIDIEDQFVAFDISGISINSFCINYIDTVGYLDISFEARGGENSIQLFEFELDNPNFSANSEPVINSISPSERVELRQGQNQLYTLNVTDTDGDANYQWVLGSDTVSTSATYDAVWENIEPGIYTLTAYVSDAEFNNSISAELEIRAKGGSGSGEGSTSVLSGRDTDVDDAETTATADDDSSSITVRRTGLLGLWDRIVEWFQRTF